MAINQCLIAALDELRSAQFLDDTTRDSLTTAVREVARRQELSTQQQAARAIHNIRTYRRDVYVSQVMAAKDEAAVSRLARSLEDVDETDRIRTLRRQLEYDKYEDAPGTAISNEMRGEAQLLIGQLHELWDALINKYRPWVSDSEFGRKVHAEMRGVDTGSTKARQLATLYHEVTGKYLKRIREAGVFVERNQNFAPQTNNMGRIKSDNAAWRTFLMNNLDPVHHPDPQSTIDHILTTLSTRDLDDPKMAQISMGRQVKFKTPDAEFEYANRWGDPSFAQTLFGSVQALAEKTIMAERLGPSSTHNLDTILDGLERSAAQRQTDAEIAGNKKLTKKYKSELRQARYARAISKSLSGELYNPADQNIANWGAATRNWMGTMMLGKVALGIVTQDSINSVLQSRFHAGNFGNALTQQIKSAIDLMGNKQALTYAKEMGVWTNALHASGSRFLDMYDTAQAAQGITRQAFTAVQRVGFVHALDKSLRSATMLTMSRALMRNLSSGWADLSPRYQKVLRANGLHAANWTRLQRVGKKFTGTDALDINALPADLRASVSSLLYRELDLTIVHPQHMDRAVITGGAQRGTAGGETAAFFTQFMSWPIAFLRGPVRREWAMGGGGAAGFAGSLLLASVMTTQLYEMSSGKEPFEWDSNMLWVKALSRSGILSPIGEGAISAIIYRHGGLDSPVLGTLFDTITKLYGAGEDAFIDGQTDKAAAKLLEIFDDLAIPNVFWAEYAIITKAMDYAMWELDPEKMVARKRRLMRQDRM